MSETIEAKVERLSGLVIDLANELSRLKVIVDAIPEPITPDEVMRGKYNADRRNESGMWIWEDDTRYPAGQKVLVIRIATVK